MSDVIWAAIVAGVVGVLGSAVGSVTTLVIARRTADQEQQRREEDRVEAERGEQVADYKQFAWLLEGLRKYAATGYSPSEADWKNWLDHYYYWRAAILVGGDSSVVAASNAMTDELDAIGALLAEAATEERWREAFEANGDALERARVALQDVMRERSRTRPGVRDHRQPRTRMPPAWPSSP